MTERTPAGLSAGGRKLWTEVTTSHPRLTEIQKVQLLEACRSKDRADKLDMILRGEVNTWTELVLDVTGEVHDVRVTAALTKAIDCATSMKQLLAALRLPDEAGNVPQRRGARGGYAPTVPGGAPKAVTSLDRARAKAQGQRAAMNGD